MVRVHPLPLPLLSLLSFALVPSVRALPMNVALLDKVMYTCVRFLFI